MSAAPKTDLWNFTGATFSDCRRYRYRLWRTWKDTAPRLLFCMLNPSTADETENDPTVARCQARAQKLGFGSLEVVNIFAWRSTDPSVLPRLDDPVGPDNDAMIKDAARRAAMVICGWGKNASFCDRGPRVLEIIRAAGATPMALKLNGDGSPCHPLYLPYSLQPMEMPG